MSRIAESQERITEACLENGHAAEPVAIWKARKLIREFSDEALPLRRIASFVQIHPNYFCEKFKEVTGVNYVEYLARIRVEKAMGLLRNSDRRISEIAFAVGFQSLSQFNRVFKRLARMSPTAVRLQQSGRLITPRASMVNGGAGISRRKESDRHLQNGRKRS